MGKVKASLTQEDFVTAFNRHIFSSLVQRIEAGKSLSLSAFAGELTDEELSVLAGLELTGRSLANPARECTESIQTLKAEKRKLEKPDLESISDEDFRKLFEN